MSIVTTAQAVPSRLFAIYAALFESETGEIKERIEAWATPPSLSGRGADDDGESTTTLFSNALQEAPQKRLQRASCPPISPQRASSPIFAKHSSATQNFLAT